VADRITFNRDRVAALLPADKQYWAYDRTQAGLAVLVSPGGTKSFYVYRKINGRPVRVRLGAWPDMTCSEARIRAKTVIGEIAQGKDPQRDRRVTQGGTTFGDVFHRWLDGHAKKHKRTWRQDQLRYDQFLTAWTSKRIGHITRHDVEALHTHVGEQHGRYAANRLLTQIRTLFNYAIDQETIDYRGPSPANHVKKYPERQRERFLHADELPRFFASLDQEPAHYRDVFLLCLLTGARRGNVAAMKWAHMNLSSGLWAIPQTKNGSSQTVPLVAAAVEILQRRRDEQLKTASIPPEYVFPAENQYGHMCEFRKPWLRVLDRAGIANLRIHDLRRSMGSWQVMTGASLAIIGKTLGHHDPRATGVYARMDHDPVRRAMELATAAMMKGNGDD